MKELKFTPENLERHDKKAVFNEESPYHTRQLCTTRNEIKGQLCTVFRVNGMGYFMLEGITQYKPKQRWLMYASFWKLEGFSSSQAFRKEIERLYGLEDTLYVHHLFEVFLDD